MLRVRILQAVSKHAMELVIMLNLGDRIILRIPMIPLLSLDGGGQVHREIQSRT